MMIENHLPLEIRELVWYIKSPPANWLPKPIKNPPSANPYIDVLSKISDYLPYGLKVPRDPYPIASKRIPDVRKRPETMGR